MGIGFGCERDSSPLTGLIKERSAEHRRTHVVCNMEGFLGSWVPMVM
jgi:hypothetical protein